MKKLKIIFFCVVLLVSKQVYAQIMLSSSFFNAGTFNAGTVIPVGDLADLYSTGIDFGLKLKFSINTNVNFACGYLYSYYPLSEDETISGGSNEYSSILKIFIGPQEPIWTNKNFYIFPNIAGNFSGGSFRLGIDGVLGLEVPLGANYYFDISLRYELQNLIGKNEEELTISAIHPAIGIGTKF